MVVESPKGAQPRIVTADPGRVGSPPVSAPLTSRLVSFTADDGMALRLTQYRSVAKEPDKGPVLLVHGAGVRGKIFSAPVETNFIQYLAEHGYDVWVEDWRASIDLPPNRWTLDQAAVFDHPAAVRTVAEETGADHVKAVIHCQGSTSFLMSAMAGLVPHVDVIVSNAVSLHTIIPAWARFKITYVAPVASHMIPYLDPQWGLHAPNLTAKLMDLAVKTFHHECDNPVCKWSSFTYGSGFPTLWRHENLDVMTHEWIKQEFGAVPFTFFKQMARCVSRGHLVSIDHNNKLPEDFAAQPPRTDARFAFFTGELNACFLADSQRRTYEQFDTWHPGRHSLHVFPKYGHLDVFIGCRAAQDTYPLMLAELEKGDSVGK
jgi:hypothetical protein